MPVLSTLQRLSSGFRALAAAFGISGFTTLLVYPHLPAHMASHFNGSGRPDGYLSPAANVTLLFGGCVAFVLVFGVIWYGVRQIDPAAMNLPDTSRWQDLAERTALRDRLADSLLWLAAASVALMAGILHSLYRANLPGARGLGAEFWVYISAYVIFMMVCPLIPLAPLFTFDPRRADR